MTSAFFQASNLQQTLHPSQGHAARKALALPRAYMTNKSFLSSHFNPVNFYIFCHLKASVMQTSSHNF